MKAKTQYFRATALVVLAAGLIACDGGSGEPYYQAICSQMHGIVRGWEGPRREHRTDALHDAEGHKSSYPGHTVTIEEHH